MSDRHRVLIIEGHPDPQARLNRALADAYAEGANEGGWDVRRVRIAELDIPMLRSADEWTHGPVPPALKPVQDDLQWAHHLVLFFPLWLGDMPALVKAFLEQVARPGFAVPEDRSTLLAPKPLAGRSARVVVTMGMPAALYRWFYRAHSVKALERNVLGFVGFAPVNETLIGSVDNLGDAGVARWCRKLHRLGLDGE
ncbi:MAG: NAD(P)H-dependent oxidoreductase [Hydrogenophaga sp.]|uniref:NAD(P)H-dependent oxidoreductase n=1 Tax=Hydrogenophaga sp. TaxID=1904254 RepID=UPI001D26F2E6|nr:NAD(P)H-dependent oxidoreductase [Hydrogenophaga sp.]MBX3611928.1 NAD(P)H-dependent oxidoreductase [Hydrogenophaga sp.]